MINVVGHENDPYTLSEISPAVTTAGYNNTDGRIVQSSIVVPFPNTAIILTLGQSMICSNATSVYVPTNSTVQNFNVYNGAIYNYVQPDLGCSYALGVTSPNIIIGDMLISNRVFSRVIMVPIGINGTTSTQWTQSPLSDRITVAIRRLASYGLKPNYILWHQGEQDNINNTPGPTYTANVQYVAQQFRNLGVSAPMFVALESMVGGGISSTIRNAQLACVSSSLNIFQGADWDTIPIGQRQGDGTHFQLSGAISGAGLDVNIITAYKSTH